MATYDNIITQIENAHQDAIETYNKLQDIVTSPNDVVINYASGGSVTLESYANMKKNTVSLINGIDYTTISATNVTPTSPSYNSKTADFVRFVDSKASATGAVGTYSNPYPDIYTAIQSITGNYGIIYLKTSTGTGNAAGGVYPLFGYNNGEIDIIIDHKTIVFDAYSLDGSTLALGNAVNFTTHPSPIICPKYATTAFDNSYLYASFDTRISAIHKSWSDSISNNSLYRAASTSAAIDLYFSTPQTIPYVYGFVLKNSSVSLNNITVTNNLLYDTANPLNMIDAMDSVNPFYSTGYGAPGNFRFTPAPSIFKDFYALRTGSSATVYNETYFMPYKNKVDFHSCKFFLSNNGIAPFYFNSIMDTSSKYEININNSSAEMFNSTIPTTGAGLAIKTGPLFYLEQNRVPNDFNFTPSSLNTYSNATSSKMIKMLNYKYILNLNINDYKVIDMTMNALIDSTATQYTQYTSTSTTTYSTPYSAQLFRMIDTYTEYISSHNNTMRNILIPDAAMRIFNINNTPITADSNNNKVQLVIFAQTDFGYTTVATGALPVSLSGVKKFNSPIVLVGNIQLTTDTNGIV